MAAPARRVVKAVEPEVNPQLDKLNKALELLIAEVGELKRRQAESDKRLDRLWIKVM